MKAAGARRLRALPPYLFVRVEEARKKRQAEGKKILNLGVGDPDLPPPEGIVGALKEALADPENHRYPLGPGKPQFRRACGAWMEERFGVRVDPDSQVCALIGSKEGIGHAALALLNPGEVALVPSPAYPVYRNSVLLAGGVPVEIPLTEKNGFLPDFGRIPAAILRKARLLYLNYPNNPTAAAASLEYYKNAVAFARKYGLWILSDLAYSELYFGDPPPSVLQVPGAEKITLEFHSLSKMFHMTGWRIGWACGPETLVKPLCRFKDNFDSGCFGAIQDAAAWGLKNETGFPARMRPIYRRRRDLFCSALKEAGWSFRMPEATFYVWARPPRGRGKVSLSSEATVRRLLEETGIVSTPGSGLGKAGEGYVRFSLTAPDEVIAEAAHAIRGLYPLLEKERAGVRI